MFTLIVLYELKFFASHNSRSNEVERTHATMRAQLQAFLKSRGLTEDRWDEVIHLCVASMNNSPHHTTGFTPYSVIFNKKPNFEAIA